ncbi:MAG: hypothetical protein Q3979_05625 [Actinomycetaceae bacterium]|nr:hypothetical protein [Actinomycetaceae bacterium]
MRYMTEAATSLLAGSHAGDRMRVSIWRDGQLLADSVDVAEWSVSDDATRKVRVQASVTIVDATGELVPRSMHGALSVAGTRLQLTYVDGAGEETPYAWLSVQKVDPPEQWTLRRLPDGQAQWVFGGASIKVDADDLTSEIEANKLLAPTSPSQTATYESEMRRLAHPIGVLIAPGVNANRRAPASAVFEKERLDAISDLANACNAVLRMRPEGILEAVPDQHGDPVWDVSGGDDGVLVSVTSAQDKSQIYNCVVATSSAGGNEEYVGRAFLDTGILRWGGPIGCRPYLHSSSLITSQEAADAAARTQLDSLVRDRTTTLTIETLPHPGLQSGDTIRVHLPGLREPVTAQIVTLALSGNADGVDAMKLTLDVPANLLEEAL